MPFSNYIYEYYDGISSGNITVGKWVRLLYEYIVKGLQEGLFTFNAKKANKAIRFIENFWHHCELLGIKFCKKCDKEQLQVCFCT